MKGRYDLTERTSSTPKYGKAETCYDNGGGGQYDEDGWEVLSRIPSRKGKLKIT